MSVATKFTVVPSDVTVYSLPSFISENVVRVTFVASLLSTETDLTGRTTSVSYTHLDVYKRQDPGTECGFPDTDLQHHQPPHQQDGIYQGLSLIHI